jgi:hypothetical protein
MYVVETQRTGGAKTVVATIRDRIALASLTSWAFGLCGFQGPLISCPRPWIEHVGLSRMAPGAE